MSDYKEISNEDYKLNYTPKSSATPSQNPTKIELKSAKNLINDKQVLITILTLLQNGNCVYPGYTHVNGTAVMQTTCEKCFAEEQKPFRKDDKATCTGTFTNNDDGSTYFCQCEVKIIDAGDNKTLGK
jgi:hypothetical protein